MVKHKIKSDLKNLKTFCNKCLILITYKIFLCDVLLVYLCKNDLIKYLLASFFVCYEVFCVLLPETNTLPMFWGKL